MQDPQTLNQGDLISAATTEKAALIEKLRNDLDENSRKLQLQRKAEEADAMGKTLDQVPLPIYINIALAVGTGIFFMILLNIVHPPAGGNPVMVIIGSVSYDYLLFPIISGCFIIILLAIIINKFILKKNYPSK